MKMPIEEKSVKNRKHWKALFAVCNLQNGGSIGIIAFV